MKMLVSIATYGDKNFVYLNRVIDEYLSYKKYEVSITVHGTVPLPRTDINMVVHENPKNTVYFHRQEFVDKRNDYDLFLFAEDDLLVRERSIDLYLKYDSVLPMNQCIGFLRYEKRPIDDPSDENYYLIDLWTDNPGYDYLDSPRIVADGNLYFTVKNPHQSCWLLTKAKLNNVIEKTEFVVQNTEGIGLEAGASGIFSAWGHGPKGIMSKLLPLNREELKDCLVHHLSNVHCDPPHKVGLYWYKGVATFDTLTNRVWI